MLEEDIEIAIKAVVVGNGAVGKSSMIQRYCKGVFTKDYKKTIGVDFLERQLRFVCIDGLVLACVGISNSCRLSMHVRRLCI